MCSLAKSKRRILHMSIARYCGVCSEYCIFVNVVVVNVSYADLSARMFERREIVGCILYCVSS